MQSSRNRRNNRGGFRWPLPPIANLLVLFILMITVIAVSINSKTVPVTEKTSESEISSNVSEISETGESSNESSGAEAEPTPTTEPANVAVAEREPSAEPTPTTAPSAAPTKNVEGLATESLGGVLVVDDTAYEFYNFNQSVATDYIDLINSAATSLKNEAGATLYEMIIPTSLGIMLPDDFTESMNCSNQRKALDYFHGSFNSDVQVIDIYDPLKAHANEYIFYRTDHHWSNLGAYYAYTDAMYAAGKTPLELSAYTKKEYSPYLGSFYEQSGNSASLGNNPDTCEAYIPPDSVTMNVTQTDGVVLSDWPMIADGSDYGTSMKYIIFIGGDNPYTEIFNENASSDDVCIIVKESFGNTLAPFFTSNYKEVYVIDYRHYSGSIQDLAKEKGAKDVFVCNNMSATRSEYLVDKLADVF